MRSLTIIAIICIISQGVFAAVTPAAGTATCTATNNPWTANSRCTNANCHPYVDTSNSNATLGGFACSTPATNFATYPSTTYGSANNGSVNDIVCSSTCDSQSSDMTVIPCDLSTGLFCATCATGYNSSGKAPTAASPQLCSCKINATDNTTTCTSCAHGYYGVDSNSTAVVPSDTAGSGDTTYLLYATTNAAKCVACPTTLTNCAQCASATTCAICTTASGNTVDSSGSCSAAKIIASFAFVVAGFVALLF